MTVTDKHVEIIVNTIKDEFSILLSLHKTYRKKYYKCVDCFCQFFFIISPDKKCNPRGYKHVLHQMFNIRNMTTHVISQIKYVQHVFKLCDWLNRSDVSRLIL